MTAMQIRQEIISTRQVQNYQSNTYKIKKLQWYSNCVNDSK